ncbi:hypothetical protein FOZ63_018099 [Perkinsus olseni]|uniref:SWIM-type domain-containing protein n=1 Tax=Perkinsus olseni TaxID=32597 RepID=A0A7J6QU73_PEROL|nr:hypothetical protein FOZ63_018099 [Perkinsus olseni]
MFSLQDAMVSALNQGNLTPELIEAMFAATQGTEGGAVVNPVQRDLTSMVSNTGPQNSSGTALSPTSERSEHDSSPRAKKARGKWVTYVPVDGEEFNELDAALSRLNELAGLTEEGAHMIRNKIWGRKKERVHGYRYRCPYQQRKGFEKCEFTALILFHPDGYFRIEIPSKPHLPHRSTNDPGSAPAKKIYLTPAIKTIVDDCSRKRATVNTTVMEILDAGLAPDGISPQLMKAIYNRRGRISNGTIGGVEEPGESILEMREYCERNTNLPDDPHKPFVVTFSMTPPSLYVLMSTRRLLECHGDHDILTTDCTYKLSWCSVPVIIYGTIAVPKTFKTLAVGVLLYEDEATMAAMLRAIRNRCADLGVNHAPKVIIADSAPAITSSWIEVHGEPKPLGLDKNYRWPLRPALTDAATIRLHCFVHMWRNLIKEARKLIGQVSDDREEAAKRLAAFKQGIRVLQEAPGHDLYPVAVELLRAEWEPEVPLLWEYFAKQWVHKRGTWNQFVHNLPPTVPRHTNGIEAINHGLRHNIITPGHSLANLLKQLLDACKSYSARQTATSAEDEDGDIWRTVKPTKSQVLCAGRWTRSASAKHIYLNEQQDTYYIPSNDLIRICGPGEELDHVVAEFSFKLAATDASVWNGWREYSYFSRQIRICRRTPSYDCSCHDSRTGACRHSLGVRLMEGRLQGYDLYEVRAPGECPRGRPRYTTEPALQTADDYVRRLLRQTDDMENVSAPILPAQAKIIPDEPVNRDESTLLSVIEDEDPVSSGDESEPYRAFERDLLAESDSDDTLAEETDDSDDASESSISSTPQYTGHMSPAARGADDDSSSPSPVHPICVPRVARSSSIDWSASLELTDVVAGTCDDEGHGERRNVEDCRNKRECDTCLWSCSGT